jgi:hypothetical protein
VAEVEAPGAPTRALTVRLESRQGTSAWFPWAQVGATGFPLLACAAGLDPQPLRVAGDRWFALAVKP